MIGSPGYPFDEDGLRELAGRRYDRGYHPRRHRPASCAAILASATAPRSCAAIRAPTLVIHGDADPLVRPSGGRATAAAIPGARLV